MPEPIAWHDLGLCSYADGLRLQARHWQARRDGGPNVGLVLEHPPTVTLGRRGTDGDLRVPRAALAARGVACVETDRGGQATYHGPGQLVLYPIVDLRAFGLSVRSFVCALEEAMIAVARRYGVDARRDPRGHGVWTARGKLGAVGIRVRRHVTTHGLAMNVDPDLEPFGMIVPCGMPDAPVTSLACECGRPVSTAAVKPVLRAACTALLGARAHAAPGAEVHP